MRPLLEVFRFLARYGRYTMVVGLLAGVSLPDVAAGLKPWLPQLVLVLLFLTAVRIGPRAALQGLRDVRATLKIVLVYQLVAPLVALAVFAALGVAQSPYAMAVVLVFAAPSLSGSPNLTIMLGADPEPAFRLLVLGMACLPFTMLPVFWLSPQMGDFMAAFWGSGRVVWAIGGAVFVGFTLRAMAFAQVDREQSEVIDGVMAVALVVIVVALMGALGPALIQTPMIALRWMALAFVVNLGAQVVALVVLTLRGQDATTVPFSVVAGNRNVALFVVTMSPAQIEPLLIFLGCYQVPMYLTPLLMRRCKRWSDRFAR